MIAPFAVQVEASFDHFVGKGEQCWRDFEIKRFGGLEIDDQFKFVRCLDRKVSWLFAFENASSLDVRDVGHSRRREPILISDTMDQESIAQKETENARTSRVDD